MARHGSLELFYLFFILISLLFVVCRYVDFLLSSIIKPYIDAASHSQLGEMQLTLFVLKILRNFLNIGGSTFYVNREH